jgi:biotin/methionine sulfoxide reductase
MAMHRAIDPVAEARNDFDVFAAIAGRLGIADAFTEGRDEMAWLRHLYDETRSAAGRSLPDCESFWAEGVVALPPSPEVPPPFSGLRERPGRHLLLTPSGKIELFSERVASFRYDDCPGHGAWLPPQEWLGATQAARFPIHLISNQPATRLHGQYDHGRLSLDSKIAGREPIRIHPNDAGTRGIEQGDVVRVFNDRGAFLAGAVVTDAVMEQVAQISTGAWYDPVTPGGLDAHGNPNVATADRPASRLSQACAALSTLVEIEKYDGPLPPIRAFRPPVILKRRS